MGERTAIEWTATRNADGTVTAGNTFNTWWGCTKVSPACVSCYAATYANRFGTEWGKDARRRFFGEEHWGDPLKWNHKAEREGRRVKVFCASMADVFEELPVGHPDRREMEEARRGLWDLIEMTPSLDWLLLTKRPENIREMAPASWLDGLWPPNVWAGTTVEDQKRAEERIPHLLRVPAPVRFLSCEPLLGELDLYRWLWQRVHDSYHGGVCTIPSEEISWVIAGGESGSRARPSHPDWFRGLRDQCQVAGVPFFFKQWGCWIPEGQQVGFSLPPEHAYISQCQTLEGAVKVWRVDKKLAGRTLDGRTWDEMPHGDRQTEQTDLSGASEAKGEGNP